MEGERGDEDGARVVGAEAIAADGGTVGADGGGAVVGAIVARSPQSTLDDTIAVLTAKVCSLKKAGVGQPLCLF